MRFMMIVKATAATEAGAMPDDRALSSMMKFNEQLANAGVLVGLAGLQPSSAGVRVRLAGEPRTVIEGPFAAGEGLIAGFWLIDVRSRAEAIAWCLRCPNPHPGASEIELRPLYEVPARADVAELIERR